MPQLPNVLLAMQSIQEGIGAALERLEEIQENGIKPGDSELALCIDMLNSIWRVANDYEAQLPTFATPLNRPPPEN